MRKTAGLPVLPRSLSSSILLLLLVFGGLSGLARAAEKKAAKGSTAAAKPSKAIAKQDPAQVELGKQLYFDPRLSSSGTVSCNSCHNVMADGTDSLAVSVGIAAKTGGRNAPTVWNAALQSVQFWDGRAATLEDQAKGPMVNPVEMGMENHDMVIARLQKIPGYVDAFKKVFGSDQAFTIDNAAKAIAAYERTLLALDSPYDRYQAGNKKALTSEAQAGMKLFESSGCNDCHNGPNFAGPQQKVGEGFYQLFPQNEDAALEQKYGFKKDGGRFEATKSEADRSQWRVSMLRNVAVTAPYFHNGAVATLAEAVRVMATLQLGKALTDADAAKIVAFLGSLTGQFPSQTLPHLPLTLNQTVYAP